MAIQVIYELTNAQVTDLMALYHSTWWASDRTLADIRTMLANTDLVVALAEHPSGQLVGFSRILTDGIYRGVIYDVIIAEDYRGQGLGKTLMEAMLSYPPVQSISHLA
ncbi:MAG: GNAT family N-acetyltransferase, partial [Cyanobacteria bacterium P01_A01_bin.114]